MGDPTRKENSEQPEFDAPPGSDTEGRRKSQGVERGPIEYHPIDEGEDIDEGIPLDRAATAGLDDED